MKKIVVNGFFAPLHSGHIDCLKRASKLGYVIVVVNNDKQLKLKNGIKYPVEERVAIVKELRCVNEVVISIDNTMDISKTLRKIKPDILAKGGDKNRSNLPKAELDVCEELGIKIVDGLGKKIQSSTNLRKGICIK